VGDVRVVYPWIGCGTCAACLAEEDNLCTAQRQIGVARHGGFASHVVVPHARYLVDPGPIDLALACTYACSGLTTHAAIRKIMPLDPDQPVVLIGAGGVGLTAIAMLHAFGHRAIYSVDISAEKRALAEAAGAIGIDGSGDDAVAAILAATGGPVAAVIDFVNAPTTAKTGMDVLAKGGKLVLVGIAGGGLMVSLAGFIFRAISIIGSNTGSLHDLRAVMALAREGKLARTPVHTCSKDHAWQAMMDLKAGRIEGRMVLVDE
jgi:alcohol dehydrogenase/propanol-preferring alcohol dehydrogenase